MWAAGIRGPKQASQSENIEVYMGVLVFMIRLQPGIRSIVRVRVRVQYEIRVGP